MKISLAQIAPASGDVEANINKHLALINLAVSNSAEMIVFPELSITGYEPTLTKELATTVDDSRFDAFQKLSNEKKIIIAVGAPLKADEGITISLVLFQPNKERAVYSKQFLHADEEPFFIPGQNTKALFEEGIALAICYELSVPTHVEATLANGASLYLASVAKTAEGMAKACERLAAIAKHYSVTTMVVNCVGLCDGVVCNGGSAVWNNKGELLLQLDEGREGIFLFDTITGETMGKYA